MTALGIYRELELFEDVINCLEIIGKKDEAITMISVPWYRNHAFFKSSWKKEFKLKERHLIYYVEWVN